MAGRETRPLRRCVRPVGATIGRPRTVGDDGPYTMQQNAPDYRPGRYLYSMGLIFFL